jgi:hypothetical protein
VFIFPPGRNRQAPFLSTSASVIVGDASKITLVRELGSPLRISGHFVVLRYNSEDSAAG